MHSLFRKLQFYLFYIYKGNTKILFYTRTSLFCVSIYSIIDCSPTFPSQGYFKWKGLLKRPKLKIVREVRTKKNEDKSVVGLMENDPRKV